MTAMTIGQLAKSASVGVETIRFYERKGLIEQPPKPRTGYRRYAAELVQRIRFIRQAQELGFSLREVAELLAISADPGGSCATVRERAAVKLNQVREKRMRLQRLEAVLMGLVGSCPGAGGLNGCTILEAIEQPQRADRGR